MKRKFTRTIYVRCHNCGHIDEDKVEFLNIEEGMLGEDILSFICPHCKTKQRSVRFG